MYIHTVFCIYLLTLIYIYIHFSAGGNTTSNASHHLVFWVHSIPFPSLGIASARLGAWGAWSLCDKTCAGGQTYRSREVAAWNLSSAMARARTIWSLCVLSGS